MHVKVFNGIHQSIEFHVPALAPGRVEILADSLAKAGGLSDVDHRPETVFHQIHTRLVR